MEYNQSIMGKTKPTINKGTNIELIYDDNKELIKLAEKSEFIGFILKDSLKAIKRAIKYKLKKVVLFNVLNLSIMIELDKSKYKSVLSRIEQYYADLENYEECSKIKKLMDKICDGYCKIYQQEQL